VKEHSWREETLGDVLPESDLELVHTGRPGKSRFGVCEMCGAVSVWWGNTSPSGGYWRPLSSSTLTDCDQEVVKRTHDE